MTTGYLLQGGGYSGDPYSLLGSDFLVVAMMSFPVPSWPGEVPLKPDRFQRPLERSGNYGSESIQGYAQMLPAKF